jgi:hypothetical protein
MIKLLFALWLSTSILLFLAARRRSQVDVEMLGASKLAPMVCNPLFEKLAAQVGEREANVSAVLYGRAANASLQLNSRIDSLLLKIKHLIATLPPRNYFLDDGLASLRYSGLELLARQTTIDVLRNIDSSRDPTGSIHWALRQKFDSLIDNADRDVDAERAWLASIGDVDQLMAMLHDSAFIGAKMRSSKQVDETLAADDELDFDALVGRVAESTHGRVMFVPLAGKRIEQFEQTLCHLRQLNVRDALDALVVVALDWRARDWCVERDVRVYFARTYRRFESAPPAAMPVAALAACHVALRHANVRTVLYAAPDVLWLSADSVAIALGGGGGNDDGDRIRLASASLHGAMPADASLFVVRRSARRVLDAFVSAALRVARSPYLRVDNFDMLFNGVLLRVARIDWLDAGRFLSRSALASLTSLLIPAYYAIAHVTEPSSSSALKARELVNLMPRQLCCYE